MPADRFAPYPLPPHITHNEYRKVRKTMIMIDEKKNMFFFSF
jgi:hypothetical protein